jgi:hypothetical protein
MKNLFFFGSVVVGWFEFSSFWHILVDVRGVVVLNGW